MTKLNVDVLILIFKQAEKGTLYSCLLVNKEWCTVIVPILWKKFSWDWDTSWFNDHVNESEEKLFNTILSCLPSSSKQLLSDNDVQLPSTSPLFDYISFCEFPKAKTIIKITSI